MSIWLILNERARQVEKNGTHRKSLPLYVYSSQWKRPQLPPFFFISLSCYCPLLNDELGHLKTLAESKCWKSAIHALHPNNTKRKLQFLELRTRKKGEFQQRKVSQLNRSEGKGLLRKLKRRWNFSCVPHQRLPLPWFFKSLFILQTFLNPFIFFFSPLCLVLIPSVCAAV